MVYCPLGKGRTPLEFTVGNWNTGCIQSTPAVNVDDLGHFLPGRAVTESLQYEQE